MGLELAEVKAERAGKILRTVEARALFNTLTHTLSEVVAKTFADTLTCVESKVPVETEGDSVEQWRLTHKATH